MSTDTLTRIIRAWRLMTDAHELLGDVETDGAQYPTEALTEIVCELGHMVRRLRNVGLMYGAPPILLEPGRHDRLADE